MQVEIDIGSGVKASASNPLPVSLSAAGLPASASGATTSVASSASAVTLLAANTARRGATITNDSTAILYVLLGTGTPSASLYSYALAAKGDYASVLEIPFGYAGIIKGIWASANGAALVTEMT